MNRDSTRWVRSVKIVDGPLPKCACDVGHKPTRQERSAWAKLRGQKIRIGAREKKKDRVWLAKDDCDSPFIYPMNTDDIAALTGYNFPVQSSVGLPMACHHMIEVGKRK